LIFINDYSWFTHCYFLWGKSMKKTAQVFHKYQTLIQTQYDAHIQRIHTDNRTGKFANCE
jgi:hypothetical protein